MARDRAALDNPGIRKAGERPSAAEDGQVGHRRGHPDHLGAVRAHHDVLVEGLQQRAEVSVAGVGEEGVGDRPLPGQIGAGDWGYTLDPPAAATGQLAGPRRASVRRRPPGRR